MTLRALFRAVRLTLAGRIDCAPRFDSRAPYPDYDASLPEHRNAVDGWPVVVEPVNRHADRVHWGGKPGESFLRYTPQWHEDEARAYAEAWHQLPLAQPQLTPRRRWRDRA